MGVLALVLSIKESLGACWQPERIAGADPTLCAADFCVAQFGTVYAKVPHAMGPKRGTVLSEGTITTRTMVDVAADVIGLSRAQIAEQQPAGTIRLGPMDRY